MYFLLVSWLERLSFKEYTAAVNGQSKREERYFKNGARLLYLRNEALDKVGADVAPIQLEWESVVVFYQIPIAQLLYSPRSPFAMCSVLSKQQEWERVLGAVSPMAKQPKMRAGDNLEEKISGLFSGFLARKVTNPMRFRVGVRVLIHSS